MKCLEKLERAFIWRHFENQYHQDLLEMDKSVKMPPSIPEQWDSHNCGVFLLEFAKYVSLESLSVFK